MPKKKPRLAYLVEVEDISSWRVTEILWKVGFTRLSIVFVFTFSVLGQRNVVEFLKRTERTDRVAARPLGV